MAEESEADGELRGSAHEDAEDPGDDSQSAATAADSSSDPDPGAAGDAVDETVTDSRTSDATSVQRTDEPTNGESTDCAADDTNESGAEVADEEATAEADEDATVDEDATADEDGDEEATADRCRALTRSGDRCSRPAGDDGFCYQHDEADETVDRATDDDGDETAGSDVSHRQYGRPEAYRQDRSADSDSESEGSKSDSESDAAEAETVEAETDDGDGADAETSEPEPLYPDIDSPEDIDSDLPDPRETEHPPLKEHERETSGVDDDEPTKPIEDEEMPLTAHIEEMIHRLAIVFVIMAVVTAVVFPFADVVINFLWYSILPDANPRVYGPLELILTRLKVASLAGFVVALPVFVYQTYQFMRPGLYPHERRYYLASVPTSLVLAVVGIGFAYFLVLPAIFTYFQEYTEEAALVGFGLSETFNLILILMGYLALVFQIPLLVMLAIMMGLTTRRWLADRRLYFWGGFLGISFLFSPDPTGMAPIIVAATMVALFEGTLALLKWTGR